MSTSVTEMAYSCPIAFTRWFQFLESHFLTFRNTTVAQIAESATFNLLSKSIILRQQYLDMQRYVDTNDTAGLVLESAKLVKHVAIFNNLYPGG